MRLQQEVVLNHDERQMLGTHHRQGQAPRHAPKDHALLTEIWRLIADLGLESSPYSYCWYAGRWGCREVGAGRYGCREVVVIGKSKLSSAIATAPI